MIECFSSYVDVEVLGRDDKEYRVDVGRYDSMQVYLYETFAHLLHQGDYAALDPVLPGAHYETSLDILNQLLGDPKYVDDPYCSDFLGQDGGLYVCVAELLMGTARTALSNKEVDLNRGLPSLLGLIIIEQNTSQRKAPLSDISDTIIVALNYYAEYSWSSLMRSLSCFGLSAAGKIIEGELDIGSAWKKSIISKYHESAEDLTAKFASHNKKVRDYYTSITGINANHDNWGTG